MHIKRDFKSFKIFFPVWYYLIHLKKVSMKTENFVFFTKFEGKKNKVEELKQEIYTTIVFFSTNKKVKAS